MLHSMALFPRGVALWNREASMNRRVALALVLALTLIRAPVASAAALAGPIRRPPDHPATDLNRGGLHHHTFLRVHAGLSEATGDFGDGLDAGVALGGSVGYGVSRTVLLSGGVAYHRYGVSGDNGHVSITPVTFNADVVLPTSGSLVPWVGGGFGVYHVSEESPVFVVPGGVGTLSVSEDNPGINFGVGFGVPTSRKVLFGAGLKFHHVWGDNF